MTLEYYSFYKYTNILMTGKIVMYSILTVKDSGYKKCYRETCKSLSQWIQVEKPRAQSDTQPTIPQETYICSF